MLDAIYINTVRLLLDVIPDVFVDGQFAIKGGTAINLFVQEAPRLSVDIDLCLPQRNRTQGRRVSDHSEGAPGHREQAGSPRTEGEAGASRKRAGVEIAGHGRPRRPYPENRGQHRFQRYSSARYSTPVCFGSRGQTVWNPSLRANFRPR